MHTSSRAPALLVAAVLLSHALPASAEATAPPPATAVPPSATPVPPPTVDPTAPSPPPGQWVYTTQYGWLWMPFAGGYTYVPADGRGQPYQYVYGPAFGWTWVVAPWVWGFGPWPYFGLVGPVHFWWWSKGWWRSPWRWHLVPAPVRGTGLHRAPPWPGRGERFRAVPFRPAPRGWR